MAPNKLKKEFEKKKKRKQNDITFATGIVDTSYCEFFG